MPTEPLSDAQLAAWEQMCRGPWIQFRNIDGEYTIQGADGFLVAVVEGKADAILITALPALLAEVRRLREKRSTLLQEATELIERMINPKEGDVEAVRKMSAEGSHAE